MVSDGRLLVEAPCRRCDAGAQGPGPEQVVSASGRSDEVDGLSIVPAIDREISPVPGEHLTATVQLGHRDDRRVGQIHAFVASHERPDAGPVSRAVEIHTNRIALEELKQRFDVDVS